MECRRGLAMRIAVCLSVSLSVRPSDKCADCNKTEERSVQIFVPYERSFSPVFGEEEWLVGATHSTWNFWSTGSRLSKIADFQPIFGRSASAVTHSEKSSVNTNRKSTMHFPVSLIWSSDVALKPPSPKGGSNTQNGRFLGKIALRLKKVCYKVSLCENCHRQCCKAFIGLTIRAKVIGGRHPLLRAILGQTGRVAAKSPIFDLFSPVAPQPQHLAKKVLLTLIGFPMSPRWTSYVVPKPPKGGGGLKNAKCPKFAEQ